MLKYILQKKIIELWEFMDGMETIKKKLKKLSATQIILLGFLGIILMGSLLLMLPVAAKSGQSTAYVDALFTSTTSVCVTGLTTLVTLEHWSLFGQIVILVLIQFGGLGVVTVATALLLILGKKVTLKERILIQEAYSLNTLAGLVKLTRRILLGTFFVEGIGAVLYSFQFVPQFGLIRGIWISVFTAISAFCNAGIDIIGNVSLSHYVANPLINIVTMTLIVAGGIGFTVWWDFIRVGRLYKNKELKGSMIFNKLSLHTKVVVTTTLVLILGGALLILALEFDNKATIGDLSFGSKVLASFFQSVTTRTAGFLTVPQESLRVGTSLICIILMFIGGSPVGTAGGVKTVTIAMLMATVMTVVKGEKDVTLFKRKVPVQTLRKCLAVVTISVMFLLTFTLLLSIVEEADLLTCLYETTSALATVGLSKDFTSSLTPMGKLIIIITMYIGRVGPITMAVGFKLRNKKLLAQYPEEDILVG